MQRVVADIVGQRLGLPVAMELDDLREVNVGDLDGRSDARAWETYAAVLAAWRAGDTEARFPGGENRDELSARPCPAWRVRPIPARTCQPAQWPRSTSTPAVPRWRGW